MDSQGQPWALICQIFAWITDPADFWPSHPLGLYPGPALTRHPTLYSWRGWCYFLKRPFQASVVAISHHGIPELQTKVDKLGGCSQESPWTLCLKQRLQWTGLKWPRFSMAAHTESTNTRPGHPGPSSPNPASLGRRVALPPNPPRAGGGGWDGLGQGLERREEPIFLSACLPVGLSLSHTLPAECPLYR